MIYRSTNVLDMAVRDSFELKAGVIVQKTRQTATDEGVRWLGS